MVQVLIIEESNIFFHSFNNRCKVSRDVLKTEGKARGFQHFRRTLRMLMNDNIMFDHYYCIKPQTSEQTMKTLAHFIS